MHPSLVEQYIQLSTGAWKRKHPGAQDSGPAKKVKQETIAGLLLGALNNANLVTQAAVDEAITNLVIGAVLPLCIVELPEFVELITTLQHNRHVMCRTTLRRCILEEAKQIKQKLQMLLKEQAYIATTTDCWSVTRRMRNHSLVSLYTGSLVKPWNGSLRA